MLSVKESYEQTYIMISVPSPPHTPSTSTPQYLPGTESGSAWRPLRCPVFSEGSGSCPFRTIFASKHLPQARCAQSKGLGLLSVSNHIVGLLSIEFHLHNRMFSPTRLEQPPPRLGSSLQDLEPPVTASPLRPRHVMFPTLQL